MYFEVFSHTDEDGDRIQLVKEGPGLTFSIIVDGEWSSADVHDRGAVERLRDTLTAYLEVTEPEEDPSEGLRIGAITVYLTLEDGVIDASTEPPSLGVTSFGSVEVPLYTKVPA